MNAGFSNLSSLKSWLLAPALRGGSDYDSQLKAIGLGVAGQLEKFCGDRRFERIVGFQEICPADRTKHVVQRYPVETSPTIEVQQTKQDGWALLPDLVINEQLDAGLFFFYGQQGWQRGLIRLTYTGGYFWEQLEPTDVGFPTAQPAGSSALPADILLAWQLQCELVWSQRDKLGLSIAEKSESRWVVPLARVELLDTVKELLQPFKRYQLS